MGVSPGLVPAAKITDRNRFLSANSTWEEPSTYLYFLSTVGWIKGDNEHYFLKGNGTWSKMSLEILDNEDKTGVFVYYYNGDTLHFSNRPISDHGNNIVMQEFYLDFDSDIKVFDKVPWRNYAISIKSITSEDNFVPSIGIGYWFYNFYYLEDISGLSKWDVSNVANFYNTFGYCASVISWEPLKNWKTESLLYLIGTFTGSSITDLTTIQDWDVSKVLAMTHLFEKTKIVDLTPLLNWQVQSIINLGSIFSNCSNIVSIAPISHWDVSQCVYMDYSFYNCIQINDFSTLNIWNTEKCTNHTNTFKNTIAPRPTWGENW